MGHQDFAVAMLAAVQHERTAAGETRPRAGKVHAQFMACKFAAHFKRMEIECRIIVQYAVGTPKQRRVLRRALDHRPAELRIGTQRDAAHEVREMPRRFVAHVMFDDGERSALAQFDQVAQMPRDRAAGAHADMHDAKRLVSVHAVGHPHDQAVCGERAIQQRQAILIVVCARRQQEAQRFGLMSQGLRQRLEGDAVLQVAQPRQIGAKRAIHEYGARTLATVQPQQVIRDGTARGVLVTRCIGALLQRAQRGVFPQLVARFREPAIDERLQRVAARLIQPCQPAAGQSRDGSRLHRLDEWRCRGAHACASFGVRSRTQA
jgi:hypothetical protein